MEWLPTPVFLPGESHEKKSLVGYCLWGRKKSDMTEQLSMLSLYVFQMSLCLLLINAIAIGFRAHLDNPVRPFLKAFNFIAYAETLSSKAVTVIGFI